MFTSPRSKNRMVCSASPQWFSKGICGVVPDVDAGSVLTQPYTLLGKKASIIPTDVYATRPFYFGGSNVFRYDPRANSRKVSYKR